MSMSGLLDCTMVEGGVTGDVFKKFLEEKLLVKLYPFDSTNPHSIVIMDNVSIHHVHEVVDLLENLGVLVYFLSPYSPNLNPIEELFAKLKSTLKASEHVMQEDLQTLLLDSLP